MAENLRGMPYLKSKLELKSQRVQTRNRYYDMKASARDLQISTPPKLLWMTSCLGWCGHAVDGLADRLSFREFRNDDLDMGGIFAVNNEDIFVDAGIRSALIGSCAFAYITQTDGIPRIQVIGAGNATGEIDTVTNLLKEGYAVLSRDETGAVLTEAYFTPKYTKYYTRGKLTRTDRNPCGYTLLVPIIYQPDTERPFGRSRISRACMSNVDSAARAVKRSEISAEFFSYPQKYVTGLSENAETLDSWKAAMSAMMSFTKDEDGDSPKVGQFAQQSMQPHIDHVRMYAALFSGETGLTLEDMGFPMDNPSSAESIKAAHETMRLTVRKAQKCFGVSLKNIGFVAACLRDKFHYTRDKVHETLVIWNPAFEVDATTIGLIGDAISKINSACPGYFNEKNIQDIIGIAPGGDDE